MSLEKYLVKVCSTNLDKRDPEFSGILYEARDNPKSGELVLMSKELENLNTIGGPICFEHDRTIGKIGVITNCSYKHPHYYIDGIVNTKNQKLKEQVRQMLKSGELGMLSIGFKAEYCKRSKTFSKKQFEEASIVRQGFYPSTKIVSVAASAEKGQSEVETEILDDDQQVYDFLQNFANSAENSNNAEYINRKESETVTTNFATKTTANKATLQNQPIKPVSKMATQDQDVDALGASETSLETPASSTKESSGLEKQLDQESQDESEKTRQERENELLLEKETLRKQHEKEMQDLKSEQAAMKESLKRYEAQEKKHNDEYVKQYKPIVDEMIKIHKANGETKLAKIIEESAKKLDKKDILLSLVRQYKDNKAKDERIKQLEKSAKRLATPISQPVGVSASAKKNTKTIVKPIQDQSIEEFINLCTGGIEDDAIDTKKKTKVDSKNSAPTDYPNQSIPVDDEPIPEADANAEIDLQSDYEKKIKALGEKLVDAVTVGCSNSSKEWIREKFDQAPSIFPGAINCVSPALGVAFAEIHYGIKIPVE